MLISFNRWHALAFFNRENQAQCLLNTNVLNYTKVFVDFDRVDFDASVRILGAVKACHVLTL